MPLFTLVTLMLCVFIVSLGYGAALPVLPYRIEQLFGSDSVQIAQVTGLLTGLYTLALFAFAPIWGWASDRWGRRVVLVVGLVGFGATMVGFSFADGPVALYAERLLSGAFSAAAAPVALAAVADLARSKGERAHRLSLVSLAGTGGFLLGPMIGALLIQNTADAVFSAAAAARPWVLGLLTGLLALMAAALVIVGLPSTRTGRDVKPVATVTAQPRTWLMTRLLLLAFVVSAGVASFEVGLTLRGKQELGLSPYEIAAMFSECSLVMFLAQAIVFSPLVKPAATRWLIAPALLMLSAGLFLLPRTSDYFLMLVLIGAIASSAGILSPILTYWISDKAGAAQGIQLGKQTAAASLGAAVGSLAGGLLFDLPTFDDAAFVVAAGLVLLGLTALIGLPGLLGPPKPRRASLQVAPRSEK